jgi:hypothetical protein
VYCGLHAISTYTSAVSLACTLCTRAVTHAAPLPHTVVTCDLSTATGPELPLEDFNRYALLLDVDGNAWSDRYRLLAHFNTPVLKQASNLTAFFEHVMAPGAAVEQYAPDLSDLPARARQLLEELQQQPGRLMRMAGGQPLAPRPGAASMACMVGRRLLPAMPCT